MALRALLFDLDGTLTRTDELHFEATRRAMAERGLALERRLYAERICGATNADISALLFPDDPPERRLAYSERKEALFRALVGRLEPVPGLEALLAWAGRHRLGRALVTSAPRQNVELMLDALGLEDGFPVMVLGDELPVSKPDPLPYRLALERLGVAAAEAVGFEDSLAGVRSVKGAGVLTVGVTGAFAAAELTAAGADLAVADFLAPALWALLEARLGNARSGQRKK